MQTGMMRGPRCSAPTQIRHRMRASNPRTFTPSGAFIPSARLANLRKRCQTLQRVPSRHARAAVKAAASRSGKEADVMDVADALAVLQIADADVDASVLRSAYYERMRSIHPDVNPDQDTTATAARVNAAYAFLMQVWPTHAPDVLLLLVPWRARPTLGLPDQRCP
jgi:hypothetical protein